MYFSFILFGFFFLKAVTLHVQSDLEKLKSAWLHVVAQKAEIAAQTRR